MNEIATQLLRGTLHALILGTLRDGPLHGYAIVTAIAERTRGVLEIEDGALYQALHRMEERGWLSSEWGHAESGKRARFYELTTEGRRRLRAETTGWLRFAQAVGRVLTPMEA
jgi:transcriptional regulator